MPGPFTLAAGTLTPLDVSIVVGAIALLFVIAYLTGRRESDTQDFFLGGRRVPVIVAALSLVATEVSALTITNVPGTGATENLQYLQFYIGSAASKIFVAFLFLPVFYKHDCTSIYEFLRHRFGAPSQYAGSIFFFITRLVGSGVRLYAACFAIAAILGWTLTQTLLLFSVVSVVFIAFGGVKAVVWTGAYQALVFYGAGLAVIVWTLGQISGGLGEAWRIAGEAGRLSVFDFSLDLNRPTSFWAGTANAFFIGLAVFGTDQEFVQRLLTVETRRSSQRAMLSTVLAALPILAIYLLAGTLIFVLYRQHADWTLPTAAKEVFPAFIAGILPAGLKGLILAAILLASIDSPLSSLASSFVMDIYRPLVRPAASQAHYLLVSRIGVVAFGVLLALIAAACGPVANVLWFAFQILSITGGSMLGIFLLGLLTPWGANRGNIVAMVLNALAMTVLLMLSKYGPVGLQSILGLTTAPVPSDEAPILNLAWSWLIVLGTAVTFFTACLLGLRGRGPDNAPDATAPNHSPRSSNDASLDPIE